MVSFVNYARIASICVGFHLGTLHGYFLTAEAKPHKSLVVGQSGVSKICWQQQVRLTSMSKGRLIVITWYFMFAVESTSGFELLHGSRKI